MISTALPQDAAAEVRRAGEHPQMVAVALGGNALAKPFGHALYHPIYEAAAELGLPLVLQIGSDGGADVVSAPVAGGLPATYAEYKVLAVQSHMTHATSLIAHGVFDIFPQLEVLLVGGGVGWIPSFLWRMDYWFKQNAHETPWLKRPPSEYFVRHFRVATDEADVIMLGDGGLEKNSLAALPGWEQMLLYGSCYPNRDSEQPEEIASRLPAEWRADVMSANATRFFRWPSGAPPIGEPAMTGHAKGV